MIPIFIVIYFVIGIGFGALTEDSIPETLKNNKLLELFVTILMVFLWIPWFLLNLCFPKRDIWFRRKTND